MITVSLVTYRNKFDVFDNKKKDNILKNSILFLSNDELISKILIIDNSAEKIFSWTNDLSKKVIYYFNNGKNIGFGKAHNLTAQLLNLSKYHIFLNPDIVFSNLDCIKKLYEEMENNSNIGLIQPLIKSYPKGDIQRLCKRNPSLLIQIIRGFTPKLVKFKLIRKYNYFYQMEDLAYKNKPITSSYLSGCFMFCRVDKLNQVNWFDERYFMYLEDADLTRKLSLISKCVHYPLVEIMHVWEKGSHKNLKLKFEAIISFFKYSIKWGIKII